MELPLRVLFEAPTVEELARRVEEEKQGKGRGELAPIRRVGREQELPLSYSQQRMWVLEQLAAGSGAFNLLLGVKLRGRLNIAGLEQTFGEVVRRHEILRTSFPAREGRPRQVVGAAEELKLPIVDLSWLVEKEREEEAVRIASEDGNRAFDLGRGPLVRIALLRLGEQEHAVACTMHHLVGDAWSFEVLTTELSRLYSSFYGGEASPLVELAIQYADYAYWQREWLQGEVLEKRMGYWKRQLEGMPEGIKLPQRRQRGAVQSFRGAREGLVLEAGLVEQLRGLSRREGTTMYMTLLSGYLVLLSQYSGQEDLVVGSVIANRERGEVEQLIGFVANTLVLRVDVGGNPSFRELLGRVRETCLEAYGHQLPPEKLQEGLNGEAGGRQQPLFGVWFQMENARREKLELQGLEMEQFQGMPQRARFELSLLLEQNQDQITGTMEYDADLFDPSIIAQMLGHFRVILEQMCAKPDCGVVSVLLTGEQESEQLSYQLTGHLE